MALTNLAIKNAPKKEKTYKLYDSNGLYVLITSKGKNFRFNYKFHGKYKTLALGVYPEVSLKEARLKRDEARLLIEKGIDPVERKMTFPSLVDTWLGSKIKISRLVFSHAFAAQLHIATL